MSTTIDQNTLVSEQMSARCASAFEGLTCELPADHEGLHAAEITRDEEGNVDGAVTWKDSLQPVGRAVPISQLPDDQLLLHREMLLARRRAILDEISAALSQDEAEIESRVERNGGRALLAHQDGLIVKAEMADQFTPWVYDVDGLREVSKMLPEKEAAKIVKHVEQQVTVIEAHDEPGNARSIQALIDKYGEQSPVGKALSGCRQRSHLGRKLTITAEGAR